MSWPINPTNGQQTTINGIVYEWNASDSVWNRVFASVNIPDVTTVSTVSYPAQPNITSTGTLSSLTVTGDTVMTGNLTVTGTTEYLNTVTLKIQDPLIELGGGANGATLTTNDNRDRGLVLHYYSTAGSTARDAFMGWDNSGGEFVFASNASISGEVATFNAYGNVHANYFLGNSSQLTGTIANANYATYAGTVTTNTQPNITSVGTLADLSVTGITTATGGVKTANILDVSGTVTLQTKYNSASGDVGITGNIIAGTGGTGNVTATYLIGNGSQLTGTIPTANYATYAGTVTTNTQPNITSVGTLANLTVTNNVVVNSGWFSSGQTTEKLVPMGALAGSTATCNLSQGGTFYFSSVSISSNWTVNFTNVPTTDNTTIVATLLVVQGATPYVPTAVQIGGSAQTIKWQFGSTPSGTGSYLDSFTFGLIRTGGVWAGVVGSYSTFG